MTTQCPHPDGRVEPFGRYTHICRECGETTFPMDPDLVARSIGPRQPGLVYRHYLLGVQVTVLEVRDYAFNWMGWSVTEVDDEGPTAGLPRTHSTSWDPRNTPLPVETGQETDR